MAFCSQCGAKISDNQKFCAECGTPVSVSAPNPPVTPAADEGRTTYIPMTEEAPMERTTFVPRQENVPPYTPPRQPVYNQPQQPVDPWQAAPGGYAQPKKKKGKGGLIAVIIVILLLIGGAAAFFLTGGMDLIGGDKEKSGGSNEEVLGVYGAMECIYDGEEQDVSDEWLELKADGKGKLMMDGEKFSFKWELDDEDLVIIQQGDEYEGTLEDDVIVIDINGMEYTYILEDSEAEAQWKEDHEEDNRPVATAPAAPVPEAPAATEAPAIPAPVYDDPSSLEYWAGDWYGWWIVNEVYEGDPADEGMWWDCCASLEIDKYGNATMIIWDEDGSRTDIIGKVNLDVSIVDGDVAEFYSTGGTFGGVSVGSASWYCRSDDDTAYDQTFWISSTYDNGSDLHFDYTFYMRPWGMEWDDIEANEPDLLPGYYYDWYLPMISAGMDSAPDYIG